MTELKTLKDLGNEFEDTGRIYIEDIELKAEAVKWVKEGLEKNKNFFNLFCEFHNITEEDLK